MEHFSVQRIGKVCVNDDGFYIQLEPAFIPAMQGLDGFGYANILWWFSGCDNEKDRATLQEKAPYKNAPDRLGTFATRSPLRPNPIALSCSYVTHLDKENGMIGLAYIDAEDGSPVLDIKPYTPSLDRVENPAVPEWCSNWPESVETSGDFDWASVFNF